MSYFVHSDVPCIKKRVFTQKEHQSVIRKLLRGEIESTMRSFRFYQLDFSLEESQEVSDIMESLCDRSRVGRIVEWTRRQIQNEGIQTKIQPMIYPTEPVIVEEKPQVHRSLQKSLSLGLEFLQLQMTEKIAADPEGYQMEKDMEIQNMTLEDDEYSNSSMLNDDSFIDKPIVVFCHDEVFEVYCED